MRRWVEMIRPQPLDHLAVATEKRRNGGEMAMILLMMRSQGEEELRLGEKEREGSLR